MDYLFLVNVICTLVMAGVIWFVQIVHYPLFRRASRTMFFEFVTGNMKRTAVMVSPVMLVELVTAVGLLIKRPEFMDSDIAIIAMVLLGAAWLSTFLIQLPLHLKLRTGYHATAVRALVLTNWIRTVLWTGRAVLLVIVLAEALKAAY